MPDGRRAIVDHWAGMNILNYIPFIRKRQKFNVYFIPEGTDISDWEKYLTSEMKMVARTATISSGIFFARLFGGGVIGAVAIGFLKLLEEPLETALRFFHISPSIFILFSAFSLWVLTNFVSQKRIHHKIPLKNFELRRNLVQLKSQDFIFNATIGSSLFILIVLILQLGNQYNTNIVVALTVLTWLMFFAYAGISRTSDLYILDNTGEYNAKQ
ncbi:hypothetical protein VNN36_07695 [Lactococcus garvieae]|uniref:hypothetical protein n=1 Tax=Lactococcus garvieae TaxID=1363 RepID=UPI0030D22F47